MSLSPSQLSDPLTSATHVAFDNLLMRYNHSLKGVVVANIAPLKLLAQPTFIDASPFAHVAACAKLLVFNPPPGSVLVGVVKHVGPDHLGLTVFRNFHAVLPLHSVTNMFQYDGSHPRKWRRSDQLASPSRDIVAGKQIRFVVQETKATKEGLFQILASLDDRKCTDIERDVSLGLLASYEEIPGQIASPHEDDQLDDVDTPRVEVLNVRKRASLSRIRTHARRNAEHLLLGGDDVLGDVLAPVQYAAVRSSHQNNTVQEDIPNGQVTNGVTQPAPDSPNESVLSTDGETRRPRTEKPDGGTTGGENASGEVTTPVVKQHKKRHKHGEDGQDGHATTPKRKKKRRYSDSFVDVEHADDKDPSPSSPVALTEHKKKKKSKVKERRKDRGKDKERKSDKKKDKHSHKHKHKTKKKSEGRQVDISAVGTQEIDLNKGSQEQEAVEKAIKKVKSTVEVESPAHDKMRTKSFISSKYENALEAVNVAPLVSSPMKTNEPSDADENARAKAEEREHGSRGFTDYDPVKTQTDASVNKPQKEGLPEVVERDNSEHRRSQRSEERESAIKKKKRKRERPEVGDSVKKKKKKKKHAKTEAGLVSPAAAPHQNSLADSISRGLARRWQAR